MNETSRKRLLAEWYQRCDPDRPLGFDTGDDAGSAAELYVDLDAFPDPDSGETRPLRGHPAIDDLFDHIEMSSLGPRASSSQLFAGFRGTGKSTELARLARRLEDAGDFLVVRFDVGAYHARARALTREELALVLAGGIGEQVEEKIGLKDLPDKRPIWPRIGDWLNDKLDKVEQASRDAEVSVGVPGIQLKARLRDDENLPEQLARIRKKQPGELRRFLHEVVDGIAAAIGQRQLVVLVDGLDRYDAPINRIIEVYQAMARLFAEHADLFVLPRCHVVYTVSPYFQFLLPSIADHYTGGLRTLPSVKVRERPPGRVPFKPGIQAMDALLARRVDLDELFGKERQACVEALALASGGHVRDLFHLVREVIRFAWRRPLPLGRPAVEDAIANLRNKRAPLFRDTGELLARVARAGSLDGLSDAEVPALCRAMDNYFILAYANGASWYDIHPFYRDAVPAPRDAANPDGA